MANPKLRIHALYESSNPPEPHGCAEIRLIRPLSHPNLKEQVHFTSALSLLEEPVDVVIIERFWDYQCDIGTSKEMLQKLKRQGTKIIFELDDDLLNLNPMTYASSFPSLQQLMWMRYMIRSADGVIVSTTPLAKRIGKLNSRVVVVPNALDERLFESSRQLRKSPSDEKIVMGYMGTPTHLEDLYSVIVPLRRFLERHKTRITFEIVGIADTQLISSAFAGLPVKVIPVPRQSVAYPDFVRWMQKNLDWDFAIAPLVDTKFNRSKSDIKYLDYAVLGVPAVFSRVAAYQETVRPGETGLVAMDNSQWEEALNLLLKDVPLRQLLASNAHAHVWSERMLESAAKNWEKAVDTVIDASR